jgi:hypothetical protein
MVLQELEAGEFMHQRAATLYYASTLRMMQARDSHQCQCDSRYALWGLVGAVCPRELEAGEFMASEQPLLLHA